MMHGPWCYGAWAGCAAVLAHWLYVEVRVWRGRRARALRLESLHRYRQEPDCGAPPKGWEQ